MKQCEKHKVNGVIVECCGKTWIECPHILDSYKDDNGEAVIIRCRETLVTHKELPKKVKSGEIDLNDYEKL